MQLRAAAERLRAAHGTRAFAGMMDEAYLAAWDVHLARLFGRCEPRSSIAPFDRLVEDVMTQEPYRWTFTRADSISSSPN